MSRVIVIAPDGALTARTDLDAVADVVAYARSIADGAPVTKSLGDGLVGVSLSTAAPVNPYAHAVYDALTGALSTQPVFGTALITDLDGSVTAEDERRIRDALKAVTIYEVQRRTRASQKFLAGTTPAPVEAA